MNKKTWIILGAIVAVTVVAVSGILWSNTAKTKSDTAPESAAITEKAELPSESKTEKEEAKPAVTKEEATKQPEKKVADEKKIEKKADKKADKKEDKKADKKESASTETKAETKTDAKKSAPAEPKEPENIQPQFLYFVDNSTEAAGQEIINELKGKYPEVMFELKNTEKNPEVVENFSIVNGNIPALITVDNEGMLGFEFKCSDKSKLEEHAKKISGK